jgi:hypothetical protein
LPQIFRDQKGKSTDAVLSGEQAEAKPCRFRA